MTPCFLVLFSPRVGCIHVYSYLCNCIIYNYVFIKVSCIIGVDVRVCMYRFFNFYGHNRALPTYFFTFTYVKFLFYKEITESIARGYDACNVSNVTKIFEVSKLHLWKVELIFYNK